MTPPLIIESAKATTQQFSSMQKPTSMKKTWLIPLAFSAFCAGCVYGPQQVRVTPELNLGNVIDGSGKTVRLSVADERASKTLGLTDEGAAFTLQGKLPNVVESTIRSALEKQGFKSARNARKDAANLHVEIRRLEYNVKSGFIFKSAHAESEINVVCTSASGGEFVKPYSGLLEKNVFFLGWNRDEEILSGAVSEAITKLLNDTALKTCLTE